MYSEVNLFNYINTNPSIWYNHTIVRELVYLDLFEDSNSNDEKKDNPEDNFDIIMIIVILICVGGVIAFTSIFLKVKLKKKIRDEKQSKNKKFKPRKTSLKPLKHNPKRNSDTKT